MTSAAIAVFAYRQAKKLSDTKPLFSRLTPISGPRVENQDLLGFSFVIVNPGPGAFIIDELRLYDERAHALVEDQGCIFKSRGDTPIGLPAALARGAASIDMVFPSSSVGSLLEQPGVLQIHTSLSSKPINL